MELSHSQDFTGLGLKYAICIKSSDFKENKL